MRNEKKRNIEMILLNTGKEIFFDSNNSFYMYLYLRNESFVNQESLR